MDNDLNDLFDEIEDVFSRLHDRINYIKKLDKTETIQFYWNWYEVIKLDCNDLNFYTRALRDKLNNG